MKTRFAPFAIFVLLFGCNQNSNTKNLAMSSDSEVTVTSQEATQFTIDRNNALRDYLDFSDTTDFRNTEKGFLGTVETGVIEQANGQLSYSMKQFDFLKGDAPNEANPSLWRQSILNARHGLFEVVEGIYQIRGFDLANMTLIKGKTGWIVIDPLTTMETAKVAMDLVEQKLGRFPVKAVIYTHSHIDHFGGVKGVVSEQDVASGKVSVWAPDSFFEHAISENVMAGNAMTRRSFYMYGNLLPKDKAGSLGSGLGTSTSQGLATIIEPTEIITSQDVVRKMIDGIPVEFIFTPESEAPAEMMFYFPSYKAFCQSENVNHSLHNLYTLRGAQVRNGQKWSKYIDRSIAAWGNDMEVSFGSHHWPTWDNENIVPFLVKQRDMYKYIHDQTLRLANNGYTPVELAEMITLPDNLGKEFYNRGYYGSVSHDVKAQYQLYFGWFDGNPANLNPHTPAESGKRFVEMMGGAANVLSKARDYYDKGDYRWVAQVVNNVVFAEPSNQEARNLLADAYTQLGYQAESGPWRNFYLTGALELKNGMKPFEMKSTLSPDTVTGMSTELFFDFLAMLYKGTENPDLSYTFNINLTDVNEKLALIVSNGAVTPRLNSHLDDKVTATVHMKRADLDRVNLGQATFEGLIENGEIQIEGDDKAFANFLTKLDSFNLWFDIIEP